MSKITRIEEQKKRKTRVNIYIDGEFSFGLYKDTVVKYHLYEGKEISQEQLSSIREFEKLNDAKEKARNYISYRERSKKEITNYLASKGIQEEVAKKVLDDFEKTDLVDDNRFALSWIKNRTKFNPKGNFALKMELRDRGVDENEIENLLQSVDEKENARKALEKAIKKYGKKSSSKKKILEYLKRRGFELQTALEVINELL
jgi:regulatory protein